MDIINCFNYQKEIDKFDYKKLNKKLPLIIKLHSINATTTQSILLTLIFLILYPKLATVLVGATIVNIGFYIYYWRKLYILDKK